MLLLSRVCEFKERAVNSGEFEERMPTEDEFADYFRSLRLEKKLSSSTMWTTYSIVNAVVKGKYGKRLQNYPRMTTLLKSFNTDTKKKVAVVEFESLGRLWPAKNYLLHTGLSERSISSNDIMLDL